MVQYYHVTDWRGLPLKTAAILTGGLPEDSRVMRRLSGERLSLQEKLMAAILDTARQLLWIRTEDGQHGRNRPASILQALEAPEKPKTVESFRTAEEFEARKKAIIEGGHHG